MAASNPGVRHPEPSSEAFSEPDPRLADDGERGALTLLGGRVRMLRRRAGLTQVEVAERLGMSRFAVMSLESGKHDIGASRVPSLAQALGVGIEDLFADGDPGGEGSSLRH